MIYQGTCNGCGRTSSFLEKAPDTPDNEILFNLYCPRCFGEEKAVYQPYWSAPMAILGCLGAVVFLWILAYLFITIAHYVYETFK